MSALVLGSNRRQILDLEAPGDRPAAEIHVFKPHRMKAFIEAAQRFPHILAEHEKRARRLLHGTWPIQVAIQISVAPIHEIGGPQPVQPKQFKAQRERSQKAADREVRAVSFPSGPPVFRRLTRTGGWLGPDRQPQ